MREEDEYNDDGGTITMESVEEDNTGYKGTVSLVIEKKRV